MLDYFLGRKQQWLDYYIPDELQAGHKIRKLAIAVNKVRLKLLGFLCCVRLHRYFRCVNLAAT